MRWLHIRFRVIGHFVIHRLNRNISDAIVFIRLKIDRNVVRNVVNLSLEFQLYHQRGLGDIAKI